MKHQTKEKEKHDCYNQTINFLPNLASRECLGVGGGSLAPVKKQLAL